MPAKSRHSKAKRYQAKKKTSAAQPNTYNAEVEAAAAPPKTVVPVRTAPAAKTAASSENLKNMYSHIPGDLRRIGVLTVIIMAILVVLYLVMT